MSSVKIINDDAIEVLKQLNDECIDLIVTDPPYKVTARGCAGNIGIGATAIACKKTNRHCLGCELDEEYYNITLQRLEDII